MIQRTDSLAALNARAWRVLIKQLGLADALRFIGQFDMGSGNYATDRDEWQKGITVEQIVNRIERRKRSTGRKQPRATTNRKKPRQKRRS